MVLNNTCECIHTLRKNAYGLVHACLCNGAAASLPWKLLRTYLESCVNIVQAVVCHPPSCRPDKACGTPTQYIAVCCGVLRCVAVCCSILQCVAVCCSVLQCVAVCPLESELPLNIERSKLMKSLYMIVIRSALQRVAVRCILPCREPTHRCYCMPSFVQTHIHIYVFICVCIYTCIYTYVYIYV